MASLDSHAKSSSSFLASCVQLSVTAIKNIRIKQESYAGTIYKWNSILCSKAGVWCNSLLEKEVNHVTVAVARSQNKCGVTRFILLEMHCLDSK